MNTIKRKLFIKNFSKILTALIVFGGIAAGVYLVQNKTNFFQKAAPSTSLYFKPNLIKTTPGSIIRAKAFMNTGTNLVSAVDYRLVYDVNALEMLSITKASGIAGLSQDLKNEFDNTTGQMTLASFTLDPASFVNGSRLAIFVAEFKVKDTTPKGVYYIDFGPATAISAFQEGTNVLTGATGVKVSVAPPRGGRK